MVKEYCDRCKKEIDLYGWHSKEEIRITIPSSENWDGCTRTITLCPECFSGMGIHGAVKKNPSGDRAEKEPAAVEKLLDIIKELVNDCMEERGE